VSETVFHIVAKDPQVKQVASKVNPPGMHEHGSEESQKISGGVGKEAARNECPLHNKSVTAAYLCQEKHYVQSDQGVRNQRNRSARAIIITDW